VSAEASYPSIPHSAFVATALARAVLGLLERGLGARAPFLLLTGEAGTGKTTLAAEARERWGDRVTAEELALPAPAPVALAAALLELFGGSSRPGTSATAVQERLLNVLANSTAGGRVAVLIVDDAHALSSPQLLELHRIAAVAAHRQCPLEILLVGRPELETRLEEPALDALRARISVRARMTPLSANETREYLQLRRNSAGGPSAGVFSRKACRDVHNLSLGVPATIEALAAEATRRALLAGSTTVSPEHVRTAAHALRSGRAEETAAPSSPAPARAPGPATITPIPRGERMQTPGATGASSASAGARRGRQPSRRGPAAGRGAEPAPDAAPTPAAAGERNAEPEALPAGEPSAQEVLDSGDPRVKAWVARFGGSGVRIGLQLSRPAFDASELFDEPPAVATPRAIETPELVEPPSHAEPVDVTLAERTEPFDEPAPRAPRAAHPAVPRARAHGSGVPFMLGLFAALLVMAAIVYFVGRRVPAVRPVPAPAASVPESTAAPAPLADSPIAPAERVTPRIAPEAQYAIAVGSYPTRDMARAEGDYLSRLVPLSVRMAPVRGTHTYRLLLGRFDSSELAERSMRKFQNRGLIPDASVIRSQGTRSASVRPTTR
jgi:type II secretory pathway predicted ATPase ExeA